MSIDKVDILQEFKSNYFGNIKIIRVFNDIKIAKNLNKNQFNIYSTYIYTKVYLQSKKCDFLQKDLGIFDILN